MKNFLNKFGQFKSVKIFCVVTVTTFLGALLAIFHAFNKNSQIQISENIDGIILSVIFLFILGFFYFYYAKLLDSYTTIKGQMADFEKLLDSINSIKDLIENYEQIKKKINNIPHICDIWNEFCETLIVEKNASGQISSIKNTAQVEIYINKETIIYQQTDWNSMEALPGVLTGFGLAGTFIAITFALMNFNTDPKKMQESIEHLISGLSVKFYSSLAGIITAILYTIIKNIFFAGLEGKLIKIQNKLNKILPKQTIEHYLANIEKRIYIQTKHNEAFNEDLFKKLETIQCNIDNQLNEIYKEIEDQTGSLKSFLTDMDFSDTIKNAIFDSISKAKPDLIDAINISLEKLDEVKNEAFNKLEIMQNQLITTLDSLKSNISNSITNSLNASLNKLNEVVEDLKNVKQESSATLVENLIHELKDIFSHMQNNFTEAIVGNSDDTIVNLQKSLQESSTYLSSLKDIFENFMINIQSQITSSNQQQNEAVKNTINETISKVSEVSTNIQTGITTQNTQMAEMLNLLTQYTAELHSYETGIRNNYKELTENIHNALMLQENIINKNTGFINLLTGASEKISNSVNSLSNASSEVSNVITLSKNTADNLTNSLYTTNQINNDINNTIKSNLILLKENYNSMLLMKDTIERLSANLALNMNEFADKSVEFQKNMFDNFAKGASDALGNLKSAIDTQTELVEELCDNLDRIGK